MKAPACERREAALAALEELYRDLEREVARLGPRCELRGVCCDFERAGHRLYASDLEVEYALRRGGSPVPEPSVPGACPYHRDGRCTNREGRPLLCRVYFCDPSYAVAMPGLAERFHARLRELHDRLGRVYRYGLFPVRVLERGRRER